MATYVVMRDTILGQILALKGMPSEELLQKYEEFFNGKKAPSKNKAFLWRRIAYRIQELEYRGISEKAQNKVKEFIEKYDPINNKVLRPGRTSIENMAKGKRDRRLPIPGTVITKIYKGQTIQVKVLENGFEYNSKMYKTLSKVANAITGDHWNGYLFFNI